MAGFGKDLDAIGYLDLLKHGVFKSCEMLGKDYIVSNSQRITRTVIAYC